MNVLIVDDDIQIIELTGLLIKTASNFDSAFAGNGEDALRQLILNDYDLMITDWHMPVIGGKDLIAAALIKYPNLKIVAWSTNEIDAADKCAGVRYLCKSNGIHEILKIINAG